MTAFTKCIFALSETQATICLMVSESRTAPVLDNSMSLAPTEAILVLVYALMDTMQILVENEYRNVHLDLS